MASSSSSMEEKIALKPILFKYQGTPKKYCFHLDRNRKRKRKNRGCHWKVKRNKPLPHHLRRLELSLL